MITLSLLVAKPHAFTSDLLRGLQLATFFVERFYHFSELSAEKCSGGNLTKLTMSQIRKITQSSRSEGVFGDN